MSELVELPRRLSYARQHAFVRKFPKTNSAKIKVAHESIASATAKTAVLLPARELWLFFASCDN